MTEPRSIPQALAIVAILFLLGGIFSAIETLGKLASGSLYINFGILSIPAYFGLHRFSSGWRIYALISIWLGLILFPIFFIYGFFASTPATVNFDGIPVGHIAPVWLSLISVPLFFLELWQYRVLTRPDIRALFYSNPT